MATFPGFGRAFDYLCKASESGVPRIDQILRRARLFCYPHEAKEADWGPDERREFWNENFALPYPVTAIEDLGGVVVVFEREVGPFGPSAFIGDPRNEVAQGAWIWRGFLNLNYDAGRVHGTGLVGVLSAGVVRFRLRAGTEGGHMDQECGLHGCFALSGRSASPEPAHEVAHRQDFTAGVATDVRVALSEIMWFSDPDRFVVEERRNTGPRDKRRKGQIKRALERPTYHSWTPIDIRRVRERGPITTDEGEAIKRRGHWRRGHYRTLRADRYARSGLRGRTILVRPSFIGDPEFCVDRSHYRILVDENDVLVGQRQ